MCVLSFVCVDCHTSSVSPDTALFSFLFQVDRDLDVSPGDQLQLMLVESKRPGAEGAPTGPPRFTITGHFALTDDEKENSDAPLDDGDDEGEAEAGSREENSFAKI